MPFISVRASGLQWRMFMLSTFLLTPLWSLQVEEQFYVLFPLVVSLLSIQNLRRMLVGCVIAAPFVPSVPQTPVLFLAVRRSATRSCHVAWTRSP